MLVTDAGDPVAGSNVSVGGRQLLHTGAGGRAGIELPRGSQDITASKNKYVGATTHVRVTTVP